MIKTVLIDDEVHCIEMLKWEIESSGKNVEVVATFTNSEEGLEYVNSHEVDLLFLDIEMPKLNGLELVQRLENQEVDIIFATAYDQFAIQAIKLSALDYILKPIGHEELSKALNKYLKQRDFKSKRSQYSLLKESIHQRNRAGKIALSTSEGIDIVNLEDILYIQSDSNYSIFHLSDTKIMVSKTLKYFEDILGDNDFLRVHHSYFVNLKQVVKYSKLEGGALVMSNGGEVPISRRKKDLVLQKLMSILDWKV